MLRFECRLKIEFVLVIERTPGRVVKIDNIRLNILVFGTGGIKVKLTIYIDT